MIRYLEDPLFWQRFLKCAGFYPGKVDGLFGPKSHAAAARFETESTTIAEELGTFGPRSENNIRSLQPSAQREARKFLREINRDLPADDCEFQIISGTRTYAEQDALFAQGRNKNPGPIVTKARGGQSHHNFGLAWDVGFFKRGKYLPASRYYSEAGRIGKSLGLIWGGDWKSIEDPPHFQAAKGSSIALTRNRFEQGKSLSA